MVLRIKRTNGVEIEKEVYTVVGLKGVGIIPNRSGPVSVGGGGRCLELERGMVGPREWLWLSVVGSKAGENYKANYKISLYRDPVRRNSTRSKAGSHFSRQKLGQYGGCIPANLAGTVNYDY